MADEQRASQLSIKQSSKEAIQARKSIVDKLNHREEFFEDVYEDLDHRSRNIHEKTKIRTAAAQKGSLQI